MGRSAIVAGTKYENFDGRKRAEVIRDRCYEGMTVHLVRDPDNEHDANAIEVHIDEPRLFGLLGHRSVCIGFIKASAAKTLAPRLDSGLEVEAEIKSMYAPDGRQSPRVSLYIDY